MHKHALLDNLQLEITSAVQATLGRCGVFVWGGSNRMRAKWQRLMEKMIIKLNMTTDIDRSTYFQVNPHRSCGLFDEILPIISGRLSTLGNNSKPLTQGWPHVWWEPSDSVELLWPPGVKTWNRWLLTDSIWCFLLLGEIVAIIVITFTYMSLSAICCTVHGVIFLPMFDMYWHIKTIDTSFVCIIIRWGYNHPAKDCFFLCKVSKTGGGCLPVAAAGLWSYTCCLLMLLGISCAAVYPSWLTCRTDIWIVCAGCSRARLLAKRPERHGEQG